MANLTDFDSRLLATVVGLSEEQGNPFAASDAEVDRASGLLLTSGVSRLLRSLEAQGRVGRSGRRPRWIEIRCDDGKVCDGGPRPA